MNERRMITLAHGEASAEIALAGAEARAWRVGGRELLWPGDPAIWNQISPILFPGRRLDARWGAGRRASICARACTALPPAQTFALEVASESAARLTLRDNDETRAVYPFAFRLTIDYRLGESALEIAIEVENAGSSPMPYACGLHPGFRWPFADGPREGCEIRFEKPERPEVPVIAPGGLVSPRTRPIPIEGIDAEAHRRTVRAGRAVLHRSGEPVVALCRAGRRGDRTGARRLSRISRCGCGRARRSCAWRHGPATAIPEGFAGELKDKPGMRVLAGGETARHSATYSFIPA